MNNNRISLNYNDTDKKIEVEIYGLVFEVSKEIEEIDTNNIENIEEVIDKILGNGATMRINEKRKADGYGEVNMQVGLVIVSTCMNAYVNSAISPINKLIDGVEKKVNNINNFNREQRRNYNKNNYNRNNRYRRY
jgi:hypothetical protein